MGNLFRHAVSSRLMFDEVDRHTLAYSVPNLDITNLVIDNHSLAIYILNCGVINLSSRSRPTNTTCTTRRILTPDSKIPLQN